MGNHKENINPKVTFNDVAFNTSGISLAKPSDFFALMKPRVMSLVVFTAWAGLVLAPGSMPLWNAFASILCIAAGAGASGALNMWYDADIDPHMRRTKNRPVPQGHISARGALVFGLLIAVFGSSLFFLVHWKAAFWSFFSVAFYVFIYSIWLKRRTPQNIVIGGIAGATPPLIGWAAAASTSIDSLNPFDLGSPIPWVFFMLIFFWTPPHFWALALYRVDEYRKSGLPMLPVTHGIDFTCLQILLYTLILLAACLMPFVYGMSSWLYLLVALGLSLVFVVHAFKLWRQYSDEQARHTFKFSLVHLSVLFAAMLVDHYLF